MDFHKILCIFLFLSVLYVTTYASPSGSGGASRNRKKETSDLEVKAEGSDEMQLLRQLGK
jgi:hypothetical protein